MVNPAFNRAHEKIRFVAIRPAYAMGAWAISVPQEAEAMMKNDDGLEYEIEDRWMTLDEFENLPEHQGW